MPSNRNIQVRKRAREEAAFRCALARDRQRRKGPSAVERILAQLPHRHPRGANIRRAAEFLARAVRHTHLVDPARLYFAGDRRETNAFPFGLGQLLLNFARWIRDPEEWVAPSRNAHRQFASLARHLLCRYDVPSFLDAAWFGEPARDRQLFQTWFKLLGRGVNIRRVPDLPCILTRRAAHLLVAETPGDFPVRRALRWAQYRALGATDRLARAMLATRMAWGFEHDEFWLSVARFFVASPMLDHRHIGPIVDFIDERRHGQPGEEPLQPNFSMRGRSAASLLRQVDQWHRALRGVGTLAALSSIRWSSCGIRGLRRREGDGHRAAEYRIIELLNGAELRDEGRRLHHCVASYASSCRAGSTAIYSLRRTDQTGERRLLTIEVLPAAGRIVQARGRCNVLPTTDEKRLLQLWAQHANLTLADWL